MFVSTAQAQTTGGAGPDAGTLMQILPFAAVFLVMYFFLMRPQQKKMKEHKNMLESLRRGDKVVTGGGIIGTVVKVGDNDEVTIDAGEGVKFRVLRSTITTVLAKTEPAKADTDSK
ncbi:preprotein translocase subunit YajC [Nitrospirillum iridis]|uniref:Sec translocon accessory complex subunit YajC n=1 Tax=Nitrospirillum iridis TaxID=765888 RepID=A0A7X0AWJ5_9PROT|nr:preprotein translocase subunit YajC [Nitrospirillum iridis]MBB6251375.1 preprotein translocase subunit YajC [Nitrospirillum iridis]